MTTTPTKPSELDATTRHLLDLMQDHFPMVERPYQALGEQIGITEAEALERLAQARAAGVVRQICGIFDTKALGYSSALVAIRVTPEHLKRAVRVLNAHPGVSHNYRRNHEFNVWFTVAMPPGADLDAVIQRLHELTLAESTRPMPTLHLFKIAVTLDLTGERKVDERGTPEYTEERRRHAKAHEITDLDRAYVLATQGDMPDVPEPFAEMGKALGMTGTEVIAYGQQMIERGQLRRFAGIINHRQAGFNANGMAVWNVPPEQIQVQLYADPLDGEASAPWIMQRASTIPGATHGFVYRCEIDTARPAEHFTPRIIAWHAEARVPAELNLIRWYRP